MRKYDNEAIIVNNDSTIEPYLEPYLDAIFSPWMKSYSVTITKNKQLFYCASLLYWGSCEVIYKVLGYFHCW